MPEGQPDQYNLLLNFPCQLTLGYTRLIIKLNIIEASRNVA